MSETYHSDIASTDAITVQGINTPLEALDAAIDAVQEAGAVTEALAAIISDSKTTTTAGGDAAAVTYNERNLNAEVDGDSIVAISSNKFTPIAGIHWLFAYAPAHDMDGHKLRLVNVTQSAVTIAHGQNAFANSGGNMSSTAYLMHIFTANGTDEYRVDHYTNTISATDGLGEATADGGAEIYLQGVLILCPAVV